MNTVILVVLDGYGIAASGKGNLISIAKPEHMKSFIYSYPNTTLKASGEAVGLPNHEVGNTEVGHLNLGAGRVVYQDLPRINMSIADGSFYKNPVFIDGVSHVKKTKGKFHIIGLVSQGMVHSSIDHLYALLHFAKEQKLDQAYIHVITDGRDSPPKSAQDSIKSIENKISQLKIDQIASVSGRYYAMDRDRRWDRVEKTYLCLTKGIGKKAKTAHDAVKNAYAENKTDEFIEPANIVTDSQTPALIGEGDTVVFFNYRIDRPRELTKAFVLDNFEQDANKIGSFDPYQVEYTKSHLREETPTNPPFKRGTKLKDLFFITMTEYEKKLATNVAFPPNAVSLTIGRVLSERGVHQLRIAESEKERFVTYYFNGLKESPFPNEDRIIIPSPKVATYDKKPEMSAYEITDISIQKIREQKYGFILINYANADMVGHTGSVDASVKAVKVLDDCMDKLVHTALIENATVIITADHGNVEQKINPTTGDISTEHTSSPVPFIVISSKFQGRLVKLQTGILADIAPTILSLMNIPKPSDMTGRNLLEELD